MKKESFNKIIFNSKMKLICHQRRERSFILFGKQFFICARCTGIYFSFIICFLFLMKNLDLILKYNLFAVLIIYLLGIIPLVVDGYSQYISLRKSNNVLRFFTGTLFGGANAILIIYFGGKFINLVRLLY